MYLPGFIEYFVTGVVTLVISQGITTAKIKHHERKEEKKRIECRENAKQAAIDSVKTYYIEELKPQ